MKHTPGPWKADIPIAKRGSTPESKTIGIWEDMDRSPGFIAEVWFNTDMETQEANAALIAAAPKLLKALKAAARHPNRCTWIPDALAAIGDAEPE